MPKKRKLRLSDLKVSSFITSQESKNVKGMTMLNTDCMDTDCNSVNHMNDCPCPPETDLCPFVPTMAASCRTCNYSCNGTCNSCYCGGGTLENPGTGDPREDCPSPFDC